MTFDTAPLARGTVEIHRQRALERAIARAFWRAVQEQPMPVMAALEAAARAVGALYRDAANAHGPHGACGCGWMPDPDSDVIVLEAMLAAAAKHARRHDSADLADLADLAVAGRA